MTGPRAPSSARGSLRESPLLRLQLLALILAAGLLAGCGVNGTIQTPDGRQVPFVLSMNVPKGPGAVVGPGAPSSENVPDLTGAGSTAQPAAPSAPQAPGSSGQTATAPGAAGSDTQVGPAAAQANQNLGVADLEAKYGVKLYGTPTARGMANLKAALAIYPPGAVRGAAINFTGTSRGNIGGTWQTGGLINLYEESPHTMAHELAHHIIEQNRTGWGQRLKSLVSSNPSDLAPTAYARTSAGRGNWDEVAAEALANYAEQRWAPQSGDIKSHLQSLLDNQPTALA
ncbi:MAG: hypothetical protein HY815_29140 [Candidatus Riflebacteria bacterium]|nr:hypothetical protein [Candidatus Riflebacteria bacterium]